MMPVYAGDVAQCKVEQPSRAAFAIDLAAKLAYPDRMIGRFILVLLIALLPLQGFAASLAAKCSGLQDAPVSQNAGVHAPDAGAMSDEMPCHAHPDGEALPGSLLDQGCCHHLALAIPQSFALQGAGHAPAQSYPPVAVSFTDHLPDRLQRPPLARIV